MGETGTTVLITDMEGSTEFTEGRGDLVAMELLRVHEKLVREVVTAHDGREIKSMGDGFMIAFRTADAGIACALDIQNTLAKHNAESPRQQIRVRMGLNVGPVIEEGGDLYGTTVNATSRIVAKARSGQILVSDGVRTDNGTAGDWRFVDRGQFWLKGLKERWTLYEVTRGTELAPARDPEGLTPFLDREDERAALRRLVDAAMDGRGALVLLSGDAGVGKTRLAEELGLEASGRGMRFLVGRCYEASQTHPFAPFVDIFEHVERAVAPETFRSILGEAAPEIARLVPHIRRHYPNIPTTVTLPDPDQARRYLQSSVRDVLAGIAHDRPLFLLLDDLHWSDEQSLRLLERLASDVPNLPILIVGTYIQAELGASRTLGATIESLHRQRLVERMPIGPLSPDDLSALLQALGGDDPPTELVELLYRETEGNIFFAEAVARHLLEHGRIIDAQGHWRSDVATLALDVPDTVRLTIGRRLGVLADGTHTVLGTAAIIGRAFGFDLLQTLSELTEDELIDALDEAERARVIVSTSEGGAVQFRFSHELIRQTLVGEVSLTRQQLLHHRIASAMEDLYASSLPDHSSEIAYHLVEAGRRADPETTVRFLAVAGERALDAFAYEEAHRHLDRALSLLPRDDLASRAPILEKLGGADRSLGHLDDALATWREALDAYEAIGDRESIARLSLDAGLQTAFWRPGAHIIKLLDRGLQAAGDERTAQRGGLLALSAGLAGAAGDHERAERLFDEGIAMVRESGDDRVLGMALYLRAYNGSLYQEYELTLKYGRESLEHLRKASDVWTLASISAYIGSALSWQGKFEEAASIAEEGKTLGRKLGNWPAYYSADRARSFRHLGRDPDIARVEQDGHRDYELGLRIGIPWLTATGRGRMALAAFWAGRWDDALGWFEEAARLELRGAGGGQLARLVLCHAYMGNVDEANTLVAQIEDGFAIPGQINTATAWLSTLMAIEAFAILGDDDAAAALYPVAVDTLAKGTVLRGWDFRLLETVAGIAATSARDWERAEQHFNAALRLADELPMRLEEPEALRFYARMLIARGSTDDRALARTHLDRAIVCYRSIGMPRHADLARAMADAI